MRLERGMECVLLPDDFRRTTRVWEDRCCIGVMAKEEYVGPCRCRFGRSFMHRCSRPIDLFSVSRSEKMALHSHMQKPERARYSR